MILLIYLHDVRREAVCLQGQYMVLWLCVSKFWVCCFSGALLGVLLSYGILGSCLNPACVIKSDGHEHIVLGVSTYYLVMQMQF
jgi:hypothetical protein